VSRVFRERGNWRSIVFERTRGGGCLDKELPKPQRKRGDLPGATVSLERALRIEPSNPLLWIEMGRLRMDQRNYGQAEALGRKALAMAVGDDKAQSAAWALIADSLKARGRNPEAEEAAEKSKELSHS